MDRCATLHVRLAWLAVFVSACAAGAAGEEAAPADGALEGVRAELVGGRLFAPEQPIWVRFVLYNLTDSTIEIPLSAPVGDEITLPTGVVYGTSEQPALTISYAGEKSVPVLPLQTGVSEYALEDIPTTGTPTTNVSLPDQSASHDPPARDLDLDASSTNGPEPATRGVLRLAPRTSLGCSLNLREVYRKVRYPGAYRLTWRPLADRIPAAELDFRVENRKYAVIVTDFGKMSFTLLYDKAPENVENFLELARDRFYDRTQIHRVIPGFLIQGGSPEGDRCAMRPDGKKVAAELHDAKFEAGTLAMAHKPDEPNSASCQFFVTLGRVEELDGKYTVIGQPRDEETIRALQTLAAVPTDRRDRPRRPVIIRSVVLVDEESGVARRAISPTP